MAVIEAHERLGVDRAVVIVGAANLVRIEAGERGQRFLEKPVGWAPLRGAVDPDVRHAAEPVAALAVEIVGAGEGSAIEKIGAHVADGAFHLALCSRPVGPMAFGLDP